MAMKVEVLSDTSVQFPGYCVYCCEPASKQREVEVEASYETERRGKRVKIRTYKTKLKIPYCEKHFKELEKLENMLYAKPIGIGMIYGFIAAIVSLIIGFVGGDFARDVWWRKYLLNPILIMVSGLVVGALAGMLFGAFILHPILAIFLKTARHTPLLFIGGSLGFKAEFKRKGLIIRFRFTNPSYAVKFAEANRGAFFG
ncbi:MAG: hypothetical protein JSV93_02830 [Candidatus Omnitrophota bacterium]|nr:MAG: hypothetical protein JSV93_02830 [Candidatus Omnitrophota bacterium]